MTLDRLGRSVWLLQLGGLVLWAARLVSPDTACAEARTVWELTPYRIQVALATAPVAELTPRLQADLRREILSRSDALIGAAWDVDVKVLSPPHLAPQVRILTETEEDPAAEPPPALRPLILSDLEAVTIDQLPRPWLDVNVRDKVILMAVLPGTSGYQIRARELDVRTQTWSTTVRVAAGHPAKLRDAAFRALLDAFAPLAQIALVDPETQDVTLRLRAAGFPLRDPTAITVAPGDLFRPIVRYSDRQGKLHRVNRIAWTFFHVKQAAGSEAVCTVHSGFRVPLTGRRRGQVEQLALGVVLPDQPTRLILQSRTNPDQPLAGYAVYSHPPDSKATELVGRTDRRGSLTIRPGGYPLRVLLVKNGSQVLVRLPLVPGLEAEMAATIANDDQRLEAEGFLRGLQVKLIGLVVRRELLSSQIQRRIEEKKFDEAGTLIRRLQSLEDRRDFAIFLNQEKKKVASDDKLIQARIDAMFKDTQKLVTEYLDPQVIQSLQRQLLDARRPRRS